MWLLEGVLSSAAGISLVSWSKGPRFFGQVDSALDSNPGPGFFFWWVMPLDVGVKLCPLGRFLLVRSSTTSSSRRQCDGGGRSGLFSLCNSSYSLWCPLWPLASGLWPLASGQRRLISGTCSYYWRRRIQYTSRLVFAFFDSIMYGVFLHM